MAVSYALCLQTLLPFCMTTAGGQQPATLTNQTVFVTAPLFVLQNIFKAVSSALYRGADKSSARPISRCILFDGENISFDASLVLYI